jgi:hypothetical protein
MFRAYVVSLRRAPMEPPARVRRAFWKYDGEECKSVFLFCGFDPPGGLAEGQLFALKMATLPLPSPL